MIIKALKNEEITLNNWKHKDKGVCVD